MSALRESPSGEPQAGTQPAVRLTAVTAGYDHRPALEEIDLEIEPGSLVAIFGPNGGGKSTLLKLIADLIQPWSGTVEVLGEPAGRTAHRTTQEDLMALLASETAAGRTAIATTHDLAAAAEHFTTVVALNQRIIAVGPSSLVLDPEVLSKTYGGHLLVLGNQAVVMDDAHHHDSASGGEQHYHERPERR